jgi:transcriptional regulator with XRE-family HTH domain
MIAFPSFLAAHDILHLGILFKRIRATRGLSQSDIAQAIAVTSSTISKFESTGRSRRAHIVERYIRTLQSPSLNGTHIPCPLEEDEASLLMQLSSWYQGSSRNTLATRLGAYDFDLIVSPNSPVQLKSLVQRLRQMQWPAFIRDDLGFIHAVNSSMLNLFGIDPNSWLLRRWESWHILATIFAQPSPVRSAHVSLDIHFPSLINDFFQSTLPYLFTPQMRALLRELHHLSGLNGLNFSKWWYAASAFNLFFKQRSSICILQHSDRLLNTALVHRECQWVNIAPTVRVPYNLVVWQPLGAETREAFDQLTGVAAPGEIFFATTFDANHNHHVNCWPEVAHLLRLES